MSHTNENSLSVDTIRWMTKELIQYNFIQSFNAIQAEAATINKKNGFSNDALIDEFEQWFASDTVGDYGYIDPAYEKFKPLFSLFRNAYAGLKLALVHGEISEALEAVRRNTGSDEHCPEFSAEEIEWADAVLRLMNYATDRKLRGAEAIIAKCEFNKNRADHTKEARAGIHGKKF